MEVGALRGKILTLEYTEKIRTHSTSTDSALAREI